MGYTAMFGQVEINSTNSTISVDGNSGDITSGSYYLYSPTGSASFLDVFVAAVTALSDTTVTYTISSTGVVTLTGGQAFTLVTTGTGINTWLGLSSSLSGASSYTGSSQMRYCWFPQLLTGDALSPVAVQGSIVPIFNQARAPSGSVYTSKYGELREQSISLSFITSALTWNASDDYSSLEEFYQDTLSEGRPFLYLPNWPTASTAVEYVCNLKTQGAFTKNMKRMIPGTDLYWSYKFDLWGV